MSDELLKRALLDSQKHEIAANMLVIQKNEELERLKRRLKNINDLSMTALHLDRPISVEARELLQRIMKESR